MLASLADTGESWYMILKINPNNHISNIDPNHATEYRNGERFWWVEGAGFQPRAYVAPLEPDPEER